MNSPFGLIVTFVVGVVLGVVGAWLYLRRQVDALEARLRDLQAAVGEKEAALQESRKQLEQCEQTVRRLEASVHERDEQIAQMQAKEARRVDELTRIEGIGPKISRVLREAGITTFAQLAETKVERLREILTEAGIRVLTDPSTWPEQAALAAADKWDELEALQRQLKGGRRRA